MMAAVRSVILAATSAGSRPRVSSISAKTGTAPATTTALTVAMNVNAGTMTSSPQPTPSAASAVRSAAVPLEVATAWAVSSLVQTASSNAAVRAWKSGP